MQKLQISALYFSIWPCLAICLAHWTYFSLCSVALPSCVRRALLLLAGQRTPHGRTLLAAQSCIQRSVPGAARRRQCWPFRALNVAEASKRPLVPCLKPPPHASKQEGHRRGPWRPPSRPPQGLPLRRPSPGAAAVRIQAGAAGEPASPLRRTGS